MRAGKVALGLIAGLALLIGLILLHAPNPAPPPLPKSRAAEARLSYPAGQAASLALPGGGTERVLSVLDVPGRMKYGDAVWNDAGVPAGPVWIRVDLERQLLSVFRAGHEIGTAVILYGIRDKESPEGVFPVLQKAADYHSITYDAPMPWMLRLTADGVAIHGAKVRPGAATHGCIGVPDDFARKLFDAVRLGDRVVILRSAHRI